MSRTQHLIRRTAGLVLTGICVVLGSATLVPAVAGLQRYVITSGSMAGTYDRGSIVYAREVPTASLRKGDVITYTPPHAAPGDRLTHRIVWIGRDADGRRAYRTRGDANPAVDPWQFTLPSRRQARVTFDVPYLGYALAALGHRLVRMAVIGLPALLVALAVLMTLWREAGAEARRAACGPDPARG